MSYLGVVWFVFLFDYLLAGALLTCFWWFCCVLILGVCCFLWVDLLFCVDFGVLVLWLFCFYFTCDCTLIL